jgi:hypothetical protein
MAQGAPLETSDKIDKIDNIEWVQRPDSATWRHHLAELYPAIRRGCLDGLHADLDRVPPELVQRILDAAAPDYPEDVTRQTLYEAGEVATLAALISEYRERLRLLRERGEDVFREAAALELLLSDAAA